MERRAGLLRPLARGSIRENFYNTEVNRRWAPVLKGCVPTPDSRIENTLFLLPRRKCFFLCGPAGTGKRQTAMALAGTLQKSGYECYTVRGRELRAAGPEELESCVDQILELAERKEPDEEKPFLLLDRPGRWESGRELLELLMEELEEGGNSLQLVLVVCETDPAVFRPEWQDMVMYLAFELPDRRERREFFEESFQKDRSRYVKNVPLYNKFPKENSLTFDRMADMTADFNYNQLRQLVDSIKLSLVSEAENYGRSAQEVVTAIRRGELVCRKEDFERMAEWVAQTSGDHRQKEETAVPGDYAAVLADLLRNPASGGSEMRTASAASDGEVQKNAEGIRDHLTQADIDYFR